jgi:hypothetical protein
MLSKITFPEKSPGPTVSPLRVKAVKLGAIDPGTTGFRRPRVAHGNATIKTAPTIARRYGRNSADAVRPRFRSFEEV